MAGSSNHNIRTDTDARLHSDCLHLGGFPLLLWETIKRCDYVSPPAYVGVRHLDRNIHQYEVTVTITAPPTVFVGDIRVTTSSHSFFGACELAAQAALGRFRTRHQVLLHHTPVALFPPTGERIPIWQSRVDRARNTDSPL